MKCRDYFCLDNDVTLLYDLTIQPEGFDLFMDVVNNFDFISDIKLMEAVRKNIPINYNLEKLSLEFVEKLLANNYYIMFVRDSYGAEILDRVSSQIIKFITRESQCNV